jgi:3-hydroxybutyrate dehydrogenase
MQVMEMSMSLKDRVAIIRGAASGIGKDVAIRLAEAGGIPVIADLDLKAASATAEEIQSRGGQASRSR